jgi:hypothetical protein
VVELQQLDGVCLEPLQAATDRPLDAVGWILQAILSGQINGWTSQAI